MVYCSEDFDLTTELFNSMKRAMGRPGMRVEDPEWVELMQNSRENDYIDGINASLDPKIIIFAVVVIKRKEAKKKIKAHLDGLAIPS